MRKLHLWMAIFALCLPRIAAAQPMPSGAPAGDSAPQAPQKEEDLRALPTGKGLPVLVHVGLYFQNITSIVDDQEGVFAGTVDLRLRWEDPRLRYPAEQAPKGFQEYRGAKAEEKMGQIWVPDFSFSNLLDEPSHQTAGVRIFPNGLVEIMQRTTGKFSFQLDSAAIPFDKQSLTVAVSMRRDTTSEVFLREDLEFSSFAKDIVIDNWTPTIITVKRDARPGWYGETHSGLIVGLTTQRATGRTIGPILIPLFASLLIPLLAIWMNRTEDGDFTVDAIDLANVIIGGLFAVIALNFTINSDYKAIFSGDNAVTRLFGLNYLALALGLLIVVFLYRYNVPKRLFGRFVQEQLFHFLTWAIPVLVAGTAIAFLLVAAS